MTLNGLLFCSVCISSAFVGSSHIYFDFNLHINIYFVNLSVCHYDLLIYYTTRYSYFHIIYSHWNTLHNGFLVCSLLISNKFQKLFFYPTRTSSNLRHYQHFETWCNFASILNGFPPIQTQKTPNVCKIAFLKSG